MDNTSQFFRLDIENPILKREIHQLNEQILKLKYDLELSKREYNKIMEYNNALKERIKCLENENLNIKNQSMRASQVENPWAMDGLLGLNLQTNIINEERLAVKRPEKPSIMVKNDVKRDENGWSKVVKNKTVVQRSTEIQSNIDVIQTNITRPASFQVYVSGQNAFTTLQSALKQKFGNEKLTVQHLYTIRVAKIYPEDGITSKQVSKFLTTNGYEIDTNKYFMLRGLRQARDTNVIHEALVKIGFPTETTVTQNATKFQMDHPEILKNILYRVVTPHTFDQKLLNINFLFDEQIKFEQWKPKVNINNIKME